MISANAKHIYLDRKSDFMSDASKPDNLTAGKLQLFLTVVLILLFVFGVFLAVSGISLTGHAVQNYAGAVQTSAGVSITPQDAHLVLDTSSLTPCCVFQTTDGTKRCAVINTKDCTPCNTYCT